MGTGSSYSLVNIIFGFAGGQRRRLCFMVYLYVTWVCKSACRRNEERTHARNTALPTFNTSERSCTIYYDHYPAQRIQLASMSLCLHDRRSDILFIGSKAARKTGVESLKPPGHSRKPKPSSRCLNTTYPLPSIFLERHIHILCVLLLTFSIFFVIPTITYSHLLQTLLDKPHRGI